MTKRKTARTASVVLLGAFVVFGCEDATQSDSDNENEAVMARADLVVEAPGHTGTGFGDANNAVDGVHGTGIRAGNSDDVFSLGYDIGKNDFIVLSWSGRRVLNGEGPDLAVFENPFVRGGGDEVFMDLVVVHLSRDGETWVPFPHDYLADDETSYSALPQAWRGFAGKAPVLLNEDTNNVDPFDNEAAGGDLFDLEDLPDEGEAALIKKEGFLYLKLIAAPTLVNPDTGKAFVKDPLSNGADIDGVYAKYTVPQ